jgi:hypothetical protein
MKKRVPAILGVAFWRKDDVRASPSDVSSRTAGRQSVNTGLRAPWSVTSPPGWVVGGAAYRSGDEKREFRIRCKFKSWLESVL